MCIRWRLSVLAERFAVHRLSERGKIAKLHLPLPPTELRVSQNNFHSHSVDETETTFVQAKSVVSGPRHHNSISYFALTFQRALLCITKSPIIFRNCQEHRLKILTSTAIFYAPAPPQSDGIVVSWHDRISVIASWLASRCQQEVRRNYFSFQKDRVHIYADNFFINPEQKHCHSIGNSLLFLAKPEPVAMWLLV